MPESHVTNVKIVDPESTIQVTVEVNGILPNESVELTGYVAQAQGALATFSEFQNINGKLGGIAELKVTATRAGASPAFQPGHDVTVFARVAKVWVTVLGEGPAQHPGLSPAAAPAGSEWGRVKGGAGSEDYSGTQEDNQSGSATAGAGQEAPDDPPGTGTG